MRYTYSSYQTRMYITFYYLKCERKLCTKKLYEVQLKREQRVSRRVKLAAHFSRDFLPPLQVRVNCRTSYGIKRVVILCGRSFFLSLQCNKIRVTLCRVMPYKVQRDRGILIMYAYDRYYVFASASKNNKATQCLPKIFKSRVKFTWVFIFITIFSTNLWCLRIRTSYKHKYYMRNIAWVI